MNRRMKVTEYSYAVTTWGHVSTTHIDEDGKEYKDGYLIFHGGRVDINQYKHGVSFSFISNGRRYTRVIEGAQYSDLGLKRLAGKFGREVFKARGLLSPIL